MKNYFLWHNNAVISQHDTEEEARQVARYDCDPRVVVHVYEHHRGSISWRCSFTNGARMYVRVAGK